MKLYALSRYIILFLLAAIISACSHPLLYRFTEPALGIKTRAAQGDERSQLFLAHLLDEGAGLPADDIGAVGWYLKRVAKNDPQAGFGLARLMMEGRGTPKNDTEAVRLLFISGETGNDYAQAILGGFYLTGKAKKEFADKVKRHKAAAEKGDPLSQYVLGWILRDGAGLPRSTTDAQKWLVKSAEQGHAPASRLLGDIYSSGEVFPKDISNALKWYEKAALSGDRKAIGRLMELKEQGFSRTVPIQPFKIRPLDEDEKTYRWLQIIQAENEESKNPDASLKAIRRALEIDPTDSEARLLFTRLKEEGAKKVNPLLLKAQQEVLSERKEAFSSTLEKILVTEFDEHGLRELVAFFWWRKDEAGRMVEKGVADILRSLESYESVEGVRKNHAKIQKQIAQFREALDKGLRERPGDPGLIALAQRGERVVAVISELTKKREERREERREDPQMDTNNTQFVKAQALMDNGHFEAAAKIFEKLSKTSGYHDIAAAYVYLGITRLARISPSNVTQAKKMRLKAISSFQSALRFDSAISLPLGYEKFKDAFDEAKKRLRQ